MANRAHCPKSSRRPARSLALCVRPSGSTRSHRGPWQSDRRRAGSSGPARINNARRRRTAQLLFCGGARCALIAHGAVALIAQWPRGAVRSSLTALCAHRSVAPRRAVARTAAATEEGRAERAALPCAYLLSHDWLCEPSRDAGQSVGLRKDRVTWTLLPAARPRDAGRRRTLRLASRTTDKRSSMTASADARASAPSNPHRWDASRGDAHAVT